MHFHDFLRPALRLVAAAAIVVLASPVMAQSDVAEHLGVPGPIVFADAEFALAWSSEPSGGYYKQEYVPAGQEVETYAAMFLIEAVTSGATPRDAAKAMAASLDQRKAVDPLVNYDMISNDATGEIILDFVLSDSTTGTTIVEWNAYRYAPIGEDGVALYAISVRGYGDDGSRDLLSKLKATRAKYIDALAQFEPPALTPQN